MTLSEGIKLKGCPAEIPNCWRKDLPLFFKELGFTRGVEIGTYWGEYAKRLAMAGLEIFTVDPYREGDSYVLPGGQQKIDEQYQYALNLLAPYPNAKIIKKTSMEALADFPDGSIDFVYIDGNHEFPFVAEDIWYWSQKVKRGGIISGHDFVYKPEMQVRQVVECFVKSLGIENYWVLGTKQKVAGEKRDKWRSWMWFNDNKLAPK